MYDLHVFVLLFREDYRIYGINLYLLNVTVHGFRGSGFKGFPM